MYDSFRVRQVAGLFDVALTERAQASFEVEVPDETESWTIGLIVGPSGSGKSTIARSLYGNRLVTHFDWPADRAVVDCFGERPIKQISGLLTAVGFSSPPAWIKPYHVLSGGERFRCDLARALCGATGVVAFDEFTSVVDRNVAQIGSAAVAKAIRGGLTPCRFVAVTCHYDVAEWLEPDWVVDLASGTCTRRLLRRPRITLEIHRTDHRAWRLFKRHHYLSAALNRSARCYVATWRDEPVALVALLPQFGRKNHWRVSRAVTLPDYQGIGIGLRVMEAVGRLYRAEAKRYSITGSHPAVIAHCRRSPLWRATNVQKTGSRHSRGRAVVSFEFLGERN